MYTGEEIEQLSHTELLELIWEYNNYIQNYNNSNEQPVSLSEFYEQCPPPDVVQFCVQYQLELHRKRQ